MNSRAGRSAEVEPSAAGPGWRHCRQRATRNAQQPDCRSGVRAGASARPAPREVTLSSGRHGRVGCVCARCERQTAESRACARREGRTAQPAGPNRARCEGRSRLERAAAQYTAGAGGAAVRVACARGAGAGASRARNGAEAGGLRPTLDGQRTAVASPRSGGGIDFVFY